MTLCSRCDGGSLILKALTFPVTVDPCSTCDVVAVSDHSRASNLMRVTSIDL